MPQPSPSPTPLPRTPCAQAAALFALALLLATGSGCEEDPRCGPARATVVRIVDGDTVELDSGHTVRLLMVDTPESTGGADDCFGQEAKAFTSQVLLDQPVSLSYDQVCEDRYGRLLAYVEVGGREINALLVERGYACVLYISPNGEDRKDEFESLEYVAREGGVGMWGQCAEVTCD